MNSLSSRQMIYEDRKIHQKNEWVIFLTYVSSYFLLYFSWSKCRKLAGEIACFLAQPDKEPKAQKGVKRTTDFNPMFDSVFLISIEKASPITQETRNSSAYISKVTNGMCNIESPQLMLCTAAFVKKKFTVLTVIIAPYWIM